MKFFVTAPSLLLLVTGIGGAAATEDWLAIPTNVENIIFAIDKASLERDGPIVIFWERLTYTKPEIRDEVSGLLIKEKKVHRRMHCADKTQGAISGATYAEQGRLITSISVEEAKTRMSPIPPNTLAASELTLVCEALP